MTAFVGAIYVTSGVGDQDPCNLISSLQVGRKLEQGAGPIPHQHSARVAPSSFSSCLNSPLGDQLLLPFLAAVLPAAICHDDDVMLSRL